MLERAKFIQTMSLMWNAYKKYEDNPYSAKKVLEDIQNLALGISDEVDVTLFELQDDFFETLPEEEKQ